ncbi:S8 family serine peptidase [Dysgonomonas sp. 25]|uniref:S8 family serine peptidase n=1 Tax=Dysgonomonas sp. 25 TaxID=2302933 RepID=UPI0013D3A85A|nr:S8 family serine peptidase [Dysgonomonas sp. 25]
MQKKYTLLSSLALSVLLLLAGGNLQAQVTIGSTTPPVSGALLDLKMDGATTKGLGLPRVSLQKTTTLKPCAEETYGTNGIDHTGLVVYNVAKANDVCPGLYVWSGTEWNRLYGSCSARMQLDNSLLVLNKGTNHPLTFSILDDDGVTRNYTWTSDASSIASVNASGQVTAQNIGTALVKVVSDDALIEGTCKVFVTDMPAFSYKFRIYLSGKPGVSTNPTTFLTQKAIDRRQRQNIAVDFSDLPVSVDYVKAVQGKGGVVVAKSKWINTMAVHVTSPAMINDILSLPFVEDAKIVWRGTESASSADPPSTSYPRLSPPFVYTSDNDYGSAKVNIATSNGQILHQSGYTGTGIEIALLDAGYKDLHNVAYLNNIDIKEIRSLVNGLTTIDNSNPDYYHGIEILSLMGSNQKGTFVGTAPNASYRLYMTEDPRGFDYPIEEDYMVAGMEHADSIGVDMLNISLGYHAFGTGVDDYTNSMTDGYMAHSSRGVTLAAEKGMFVVTAAGNDGSWVDPPSDSPGALAVGGINSSSAIWGSSNRGMTSDGRIKPDVVALGVSVPVISTDGNSTGNITSSFSGTSFSSPITCGLAACLWQAYPKLTSKELLQVIKESSDRYASPALPYGYGKPDWAVALTKAKAISDAKH